MISTDHQVLQYRKDAALLAPDKWKPEYKANIPPEGTAIKKQENTTTKQIATRNIHVKKLHAKLGHTGEDRMRATKKHLHYSNKGTLEVCEDCATAKSKEKLLHKVAEERELQPVEMIYLDISSQKKPSYGGSKNWILIQDLDTKQKWSIFTKAK